MASITFEYGKPKKDNSRAVVLILRNAGTRYRIPSGIMLTSKDYRVSRDGSIRITNNEVAYDIEGIKTEIIHKVNNVLRNTICIRFTAEKLYNLAMRPDKRDVLRMDIIRYTEEWMKTANLKNYTIYKSMLSSLKKYAKSETVMFGEINYSFVSGYMKSLNGTPAAQNQYMTRLKHIWNIACLEFNEDNDFVLSPLLFNKISIPKQKRAGQRALTLEEVRQFFSYDYKKSKHRKIRDIALLSFCLMGMNAIDLYNMSVYEDGKIKYERSKTKDKRDDNAYMEIHVHEIIKPILEKFADDVFDRNHKVLRFHRETKNYMQFYRFIFHGIKTMGELIGIENLTFYQFRHSFASIARNNLRISKGDIDEMLNHVGDNRMADVYIKKDFTIINDFNKKIIDFVFNE